MFFQSMSYNLQSPVLMPEDRHCLTLTGGRCAHEQKHCPITAGLNYQVEQLVVSA